jgi:probable HAF family extracellular repeat protein
MYRRTRSGAIALVTAVLAPCATADGADRYRVVVLEPLDGGPVVAAHDINASGVVSGTSGSAQVVPGQHAVVWAGGSVTNLDPIFDISQGLVINDAGVVAGLGSFCPPQNGPCSTSIARALPGGEFLPVGTLGGNAAEVADINAAGDFVGWSYDESNSSRAFLYTETEGLLNLGTLGGFASQANAINDAGLVVGNSYTDGFELHPFAWQAGVMHDLGTLGGTHGSAVAVNAAGVIVGYATTPDSQSLAFRATVGGGLLEIPMPTGALSSEATVINDAGTIGGVWTDDSGERLFVHHIGEGTIDLGAPADDIEALLGPVGINDSGAMAGMAFTGIYELLAWHWSPDGGLALLDDLIVGGPPLDITAVGDINNDGLIAVTGMEPGTFQARAAVLVPVHDADLNADGVVNVADMVLVITSWGACGETPCTADTNDDGVVDVVDLVFLLTNWS